MKKTSIKDIDGDRVTFEQQTWAGFKIETNHCHRAFQNYRGPAVALAVLEASTWGNSFPAKELRALIATMNPDGPELDPESIVDAVVLADPADGFADAVRTALAALTKAGIPQREHEQSRYGSPASLEHSACILTEWIDMDERAAKLEALTRRRDDLAHEFAENPGGYAIAALSTQRAIDRVIELENAAHGVSK